MKRLLPALLVVAAACGPPAVKPVSSPDPETSCPGGAVRWRLDLADQRAERTDSSRAMAGVRDSIVRSFPGCRWQEGPGVGAIRIEVHRFQVGYDGELWNAAVDWTVLVTDAGGRTLTQFDATAEVSRPNYRGSNNEKAALQEAFDQVLGKTLAGLRTVHSTG